MTGAEYIAEFLRQRGVEQVFLMTGGACAFIIDAIARNPGLKYVCFQHEQAAAMAADASWRIQRKVGVTVATSGPGATNLITGIACSYFDSIPTLHITGQVNQNEKATYQGAAVRQAGFQETKIVEIVRPITKFAVQVTNGDELKNALVTAYNQAISGRMGPVLIDVPMDVQKADVAEFIHYAPPAIQPPDAAHLAATRQTLEEFFADSSRPLVLAGAGIGLAGAEEQVFAWLRNSGLPFVSSWNGLSYFDHDLPNYCGQIGVYGNRGANFLIQNCDRLLVLGSRLDNRQRSGDANSFASKARIHVIDVDGAEIDKYANNCHITGTRLDIAALPAVLDDLSVACGAPAWNEYVAEMKARYFGRCESTIASNQGTLSPYAAVQRINDLIDDDACVAVDTGATLCWVYQSFHRRRHALFTAGGNSPMGYALPAAIGAALYQPERQVVCCIGDGGLQLNIQELQTLRFHNLNVKIFVFHNSGYGIIKQFQDQYCAGRYAATGTGYSAPDFCKVAAAYGIPATRVTAVDQLEPTSFDEPGPALIELVLHPNTWIEPKLVMGHSIDDQFPYLSDREYTWGMRFSGSRRKQPDI
jgi:acetolactate synthase-1/2/3 large subunit